MLIKTTGNKTKIYRNKELQKGENNKKIFKETTDFSSLDN